MKYILYPFAMWLLFFALIIRGIILIGLDISWHLRIPRVRKAFSLGEESIFEDWSWKTMFIYNEKIWNE